MLDVLGVLDVLDWNVWALFQRSWDKLRPGGPIKQGIQTYSFCVWLDIFVFCFWYDSGWYGIQMHSVEVPLGPTNRKKLERTLQDGSFGVCLGDVWNIVTVTDFIVLARNTSTLNCTAGLYILLYPCRKWRRDSLWAWFLAWVFSRRRVGMDESCYSCGGSFVVLDHCTLIHIDSSLYILLLSWSRSSPSSKPWFLGFHADTKRQHADYISLETVNTSWDTSNGRQEMHWRNTKTT